jgi:hypothetical protein
MSEIFVDNIKHQSSQGSGTITLGASGETIALASGASVTGNGLVGITMADQWRLTADTGNATGFINSNWERVDETTYGSIGTGLTESSGVFSFPQTGIYFIDANIAFSIATGDTGGASARLTVEIDGVDDYVSVGNLNNVSGSVIQTGYVKTDFLYDVTDVSTHKFKFYLASAGTGTVFRGNTTQSETHFTVIRLGDT